MTMFGKQFWENTNRFGCYGVFMGELGGYDCFENKGEFVGSDNFRGDQIMAEQEDSRTESTTVNETAGSSSKDEREDGNWLQLGIGSSTSQEIINKQDDDPNSQRTGLVELNLLPEASARDQIRPLGPPEFGFRPPAMPVSNIRTAGPGSGFVNYMTATGTTSPTPLFLQRGVGSSSSFLFPQHQDVNWAFRPVLPRNLLVSSSSATSSSSSSLMPQGPSYTAQPSFHFQPQLRGVDVAGPSFDFRIIDPPRRPRCGIWFLLQASPNQEKAPILPQIPKSYLRIKDGRMTVRLLMKYLVNKLRLDNESEIEIRCRGERLEPHFTLQHVRDTIWNNTTLQRSHAVTLNFPSSSSSSTIATDHIMVLQYSRS